MTTMLPPVMDPEMEVPEENLIPQMPSPVPSMNPTVNKVEIGSSIVLTDEEKKALKYIFQTITRPDDDIREKMVPIWQMYENYWRGLQDVVYDSQSHAFLSAAGVLKQANELEDNYI